MSCTKPKFPHIVPIVTMRCNLRCKLCILDVPYYRQPYHPSLEYLCDLTDRVFAMGDYEIFEFNGGEPLLRGDLAKLWRYAHRYLDCADRFKCVTNGTILPNDELVDAWRSYGTKFHLIVDHYGPDLSPNAEAALSKVRSAGISCELRDMHTADKHHGGWVDFSAGGLLHTPEAAAQIYQNCGQLVSLRHCCNIINGLLMPCHMQFKLHDRGISVPKQNEYIDMFDDTEPLAVKREKMAAFTDPCRLPMLTACMYCQGLNDAAPRVAPAEQLAGSEWKTTAGIECSLSHVTETGEEYAFNKENIHCPHHALHTEL